MKARAEGAVPCAEWDVIQEREVEARVGIEPTHKGFADLSLTAWVPRLNVTVTAALGCQPFNPLAQLSWFAETGAGDGT